ncbi:hypothetical protein NKI25_32810 [Mesorhizobium sp. M0808]|uniref:hypothetical protein n=1 Tax=Mesorhizobium sp. M0808 TaxID=2957002 RepID=UPI00333CB07F
MSATVGFAATGTDKWLKVTDNINTSAVEEWFQKVGDGARPITVSTFDESNGEVKVEVKRDGASDYKAHSHKMPVQDGEEYSIDDTGLPPIEDEKPKDTE